MTIRETSDFVCNELISKLPIVDGCTLLEPSCGEGRILDYLSRCYSFKNLNITGIELNKEKFELVKSKFSLHEYSDNNYNFYQRDFLNYDDKIRFDCIVAAPPFKGNIDLEHIMRMEFLLKHKGILSSLISPYFMCNNEVIQVRFRRWLNTKFYNFKLLPDESFMEKNKTVPTGIITIYKK